MDVKLERLLSKSLTTLEVMAYYLVVHTGPDDSAESCRVVCGGLVAGALMDSLTRV